MANILHLVLHLTQNCKTADKTLTLITSSLKGQPGARSSRLRRVREGSDHFVSFVRSHSLNFCKWLFSRLEPVTSWSQGNSFTAAPRLPF